MTEHRYGVGFTSTLMPQKLTIGTTFPIEAHMSPVPDMRNQVQLAQMAEQLGFAAVWCRDVPLLDPSFGDAGQIYDPWVWLGFMAAHTSRITLATGSIILPLRQPVDLAKAAASVDQLSNGRLLMGVATGDRPVEYQVYKDTADSPDEAFRQTIEFIRKNTHRPEGWNDQMAVASRQLNLLPKSYHGDIPQLVTGNSRQSIDWIAENGDGWLMYPKSVDKQKLVLQQWQDALDRTQQHWKPFAQSLYVDLAGDPAHKPEPIHLGYRLGRDFLIEHLHALQSIGVNHVTLNLRFSKRPIDEVLNELGEFVIPNFPHHGT